MPTHPWLIEIAVDPKTEADRDRFNSALSTLVMNHFGLDIAPDPDSGGFIFRGVSEQQVNNAIDALRRYKVGFNVGAPQIVYRETITRPTTVEYIHKKQIGGSGEFAGVKIVVEPQLPGAGFVFESRIADAAVPEKYIPGVEKGLQSALSAGVLAGFPVVDLKVELAGGKYHDIDSSALAFEIAARMALREALQLGTPVLLEPIMAVEVTTPAGSEAAVIRDLEARGSVQSRDMRGDEAVVRAEARLVTLLGYEDVLRLLTRGRATFLIRFDHYAPVPPLDDPPFRPAIGMRP
jgi:elongation factor G